MKRVFACSDCGHTWSVAFGTGRPEKCPQCGSTAIHRQHEAGTEGGPGHGESRRHHPGGGGQGSCGAGRPGRFAPQGRGRRRGGM
ncbi:hypothetical protein [Prosthecochloris sp. HL-130-GSB]|jgi:uncharacterized protein|uniref:hypothetical protein n=1 Tax=Prosthecochloris sp. HL-130-GSB TaxID=1974213 RepID=UPI0012F4E5D7|nr:hypothetical protein [Prosthecochloris sp. HL-130-GSB]MBO8092639.1 hypothetical protein [Prosthecochloris sp.]